MEPTRQIVVHEPPYGFFSHDVFFVTVCMKLRGVNSLANEKVAPKLIESVVHRHTRREWYAHLFLVMPDHVHLLVSMAGDKTLSESIRVWKAWHSKTSQIVWQKNFHDHRVRHEESLQHKAEYILQNPVRAKLVERAQDWPWRWQPC